MIDHELFNKHLKGKKLVILGDSKYSIGKNKKEIKQVLANYDAKIVDVSKPHDAILIGHKHQSLHYLKKDSKLLFERELQTNQLSELEQKAHQMIRNLLQMDNITIEWLEIGDGLTEEELLKIEQKIKRPLPSAIRSFYQLFGHFKLLWSFKNPPVKGRQVYIGKTLYLHSGQHNGCINILPLNKVITEKWAKTYEFQLPDDKQVYPFDLYSYYHIISFELGEAEDPAIYLGEDHGVEFIPVQQLTFSKYINMLFGIYGYVNRFTNTSNWITDGAGYVFDLSHVVDEKDEINIEKSQANFVNLDTSNAKAIEQYKTQKWATIYQLLEEKAFAKALTEAKFFAKYDLNAYGVMLDIWAIENNEEMYYKGLEVFVARGFDLLSYEKETTHRQFIDSETYKTFREKLN